MPQKPGNISSDSLPVCKDLTSVRETVETGSNMSQPSFFSAVCDYCTHLDTLSSHSVSGGSLEPTALYIQPDFQTFFRRHNSITHARSFRRLAHVIQCRGAVSSTISQRLRRVGSRNRRLEDAVSSLHRWRRGCPVHCSCGCNSKCRARSSALSAWQAYQGFPLTAWS